MIAILTGDIRASRLIETSEWMVSLRNVLNRYGQEPRDWEIFRGDSFQLQTRPEEALEAAIMIKATVKMNQLLDVRIGIGLGEKTFEAGKVTESNGTAFIYSGECFDALKKRNLGLLSKEAEFDLTWNTILNLVSFIADGWTPNSAETIRLALEHPLLTQKELASLMNLRAQSSVSEALQRGGYDEILGVLNYYKSMVKECFCL